MLSQSGPVYACLRFFCGSGWGNEDGPPCARWGEGGRWVAATRGPSALDVVDDAAGRVDGCPAEEAAAVDVELLVDGLVDVDVGGSDFLLRDGDEAEEDRQAEQEPAHGGERGDERGR